MRTWIAISVALATAGGCAPGLSKLEVMSTKPVPIVADCIGEQWGRSHPVSVTSSPGGVMVRADLGQPGLLIQADVVPALHGSQVSFSTEYHGLVLDSDPLITQALACAA